MKREVGGVEIIFIITPNDIFVVIISKRKVLELNAFTTAPFAEFASYCYIVSHLPFAILPFFTCTIIVIIDVSSSSSSSSFKDKFIIIDLKLKTNGISSYVPPAGEAKELSQFR
uniref:Uncharacterized protein n=1 Tax=Glossina austeni TaxID=7395 RepID=A0A1A9UDU5_GLOAU